MAADATRAALKRAFARVALPREHWARRHWLLLLSGVFSLALAVLYAWATSCGFSGCPSTAQIQAFRPTEGSRVLDRSGATLGRLTYVRRINVPLARVPKQVRAAFIAVEDRRFYFHHGVDWRSAGRATLRNFRHFGVEEGFSTITMQVVRNAFIPELAGQRSLKRKLIEINLAHRLEKSLSKQQILELYLNIIYFGNGTYGVEAASRDLFGKSVSRLTLAEAATLAGLPKAPSAYAPRRHPERATDRRNLVLALMVREGYITSAAASAATAKPLAVAEDEWRPVQDSSAAIDPIRAFVDSVLGDRVLTEGDLIVRTTLDGRAQRAAETAVRVQGAAIGRSSGAGVEGAMVALDPRNGEVRALVGARQYTRRGFNRALSARRQPGSAFKPFVYAAALARGVTPAEVLDDAPVEIEQEGEVWAPANFGDEYHGPLTLRRALMRSANAATVRLAMAVGPARVVDLARRAGIASPMEPVPSIALGSLEVTPVELVAAYAPFANGGLRVRPSLVRRIETADGQVLWKARPDSLTRVLDRREAFQLTSMLRSVVDGGTGYALREMGVRGPVAGKTGTTNDGNDVWFIGYTPTLVAGFWFGYDTPRSLGYGASGGRLAAPAWASFYLRGWREGLNTDWAPPPGLVTRTIDGTNGLIANEWCPVTQREWFKLGTEPTHMCREHNEPFEDRVEELGRKIGGAIRRVLGI
ncbi:MAG: PBP1A family penicillin-binding protein [Gemmatimonadales bacterium]|nr:PBP1A family penicillin-binding protein [Gemmatimonadales bacterium]